MIYRVIMNTYFLIAQLEKNLLFDKIFFFSIFSSDWQVVALLMLYFVQNSLKNFKEKMISLIASLTSSFNQMLFSDRYQSFKKMIWFVRYINISIKMWNNLRSRDALFFHILYFTSFSNGYNSFSRIFTCWVCIKFQNSYV